MVGVRGGSCQPAASVYFQSGISAVAYVPFSASGPPTLQRLPGWHPFPAFPLAGGGQWAGPGAWRTSKLACSEGWPSSAGRRLVLPDGGLQLRRGKEAAGLTQVSLRHARLHQASAQPGPGVGGVTRPRTHPGGCTCERSGAGMLGTEPLSFVRGRRWGRCGPRGRAGTGREGAAGAIVELWSLSVPCWARRTFEAAALFSFLLHRKKNSPARFGYSILWTQK